MRLLSLFFIGVLFSSSVFAKAHYCVPKSGMELVNGIGKSLEAENLVPIVLEVDDYRDAAALVVDSEKLTPMPDIFDRVMANENLGKYHFTRNGQANAYGIIISTGNYNEPYTATRYSVYNPDGSSWIVTYTCSEAK